MSYHYLEDVSIADVAFEARGKTLNELFMNAALAVTNTMVKNVKTVDRIVVKNVDLEADSLEMLLYRFLQELVFYKDAELLLFSEYAVDVRQETETCRLKAVLRGEELSLEKHELAADVKAVSLHNFKVQKIAKKWRAEVILDV